MFERTVETSETPHVTINECLGNLTVRGDAERQIRLLMPDGDDDVDWEREGETVTLSLPANGTLVCPFGATLTIRNVLGNLRVEGVKGPVAINAVHGNATLRAVGPATLEGAFGNLSAHDVAGRLECHGVKGNARVCDVADQVILTGVAGSLFAEGLEGGLMAEKVRGNVRLGPPLLPDAVYRLEAYGNLTVILPLEASLKVALRAGGGARSRIPGLELENADGGVMGKLGTAEAELDADVRGHVVLRPLEIDEGADVTAGWNELGAHIEWQVSDALARMATYLEESLGQVDGERIRHRVDRATEQARRKAEQAAERARMRAERAERRWQRASGRRSVSRGRQATDEERLRVLRMVEKGKITPEQASELLGAIEGH